MESLERKNQITRLTFVNREIQCPMERFNNNLSTAQHTKSAWKNKSLEVCKLKHRKKKNRFLKIQKIKDLWGAVKRSNIHVIVAPGKKEGAKQYSDSGQEFPENKERCQHRFKNSVYPKQDEHKENHVLSTERSNC